MSHTCAKVPEGAILGSRHLLTLTAEPSRGLPVVLRLAKEMHLFHFTFSTPLPHSSFSIKLSNRKVTFFYVHTNRAYIEIATRPIDDMVPPMCTVLEVPISDIFFQNIPFSLLIPFALRQRRLIIILIVSRTHGQQIALRSQPRSARSIKTHPIHLY